MSKKRKNFLFHTVGPFIVITVVAVVAFIAYAPFLGAENVIVPLWGNDYSKMCVWHSDTNASGDEIEYDTDYHRDTIAMVGHIRSDGETSRHIVHKIWRYDGCKLYLNVQPTTPGCSLFVRATMSLADTSYMVVKDSSEGTAIKKVYSFFPYFDDDSLHYFDDLEVVVIIADTIKNDTAEFDRRFKVSGALLGKD